MHHVFIIGSKGVPAQYGGFETFVDNLVSRLQSDDVKFFVSCMGRDNKSFTYNQTECYSVKTPNVGSASAVIYDFLSLRLAMKRLKSSTAERTSIYILGARIGPILLLYRYLLRHLGITLYLNPDGHEWRRSKWNRLVRLYWKISEALMVRSADVIVCDSKAIEKYIRSRYPARDLRTVFIAYGTDLRDEGDSNSEAFSRWALANKIESKRYFLMVGRFVPENNFDTVLREFVHSNCTYDLVIVTNHHANLKWYEELAERYQLQNDTRVKFVGTVYKQNLLKDIRRNAGCYIHGHEVGGTNPSLIEALSETEINVLYDVQFNREVAEGAAVYFTNAPGDLAGTLEGIETWPAARARDYGVRARERIASSYTWEYIVRQYESLFE